MLLGQMPKGGVFFSCKQYIENGLHIKSNIPVLIEKLFSKTHAPVFGLGMS